MRDMIIPAVIGVLTFFVVLSISVALGYYCGISAGEAFGTPGFGEYTETSIALGSSLGLIIGMVSFAISSGVY